MTDSQFAIVITLIIVFSAVPWTVALFFWKKTKHKLKRKMGEEYKITIIQEIAVAVNSLKKAKVGGTFVVDYLNDVTPHIVDTQILDAKLSANLLINIFEGHNTPLHDGAVIISPEGRIKSAAAYITKISSDKIAGKKMGTRHRSAKGLSEITRAIVIVLSEETGNVTIFKEGDYHTIKAKDIVEKLSEVWIQ